MFQLGKSNFLITSTATIHLQILFFFINLCGSKTVNLTYSDVRSCRYVFLFHYTLYIMDKFTIFVLWHCN